MERFSTENSEEKIEKTLTCKISPESEEYISHLETLRGVILDEKYCFADFNLDLIDSKENLIKIKRGEISGPAFLIKETEEGLLRKREEIIEETRTDFILRFKNIKSEDSAREIFIEALGNLDIETKLRAVVNNVSSDVVSQREKEKTNSGMKKMLRQMFPEIAEREDKTDLLIYALQNDILDNELWLEILRNHRAEFLEKGKEFDEKIKPEFQADFLKSYADLSYRGVVPLSIKRVLEILELTTVKLDDAIEHQFNESDGSYYIDKNLVLIGSKNFKHKEVLYKTYVHEMTHALSGKTVRIIDNEGIKTDRIGFVFVKRFRWLNEAITESITQLISNKETGSYADERKLLDRIVQKSGLSWQDFYNAYFEHYNPEENDTNSGAISNWKKLNSELTNRLGKHFLLNLDNEIKRVGIKKVLESMQDTPK